MTLSIIHVCRYEGLRATLYQLQSKLLAMTGEDPLKDKGVSIIAPQFAPQKEITRTSDGIHVYMTVDLDTWHTAVLRQCVGKRVLSKLHVSTRSFC